MPHTLLTISATHVVFSGDPQRIPSTLVLLQIYTVTKTEESDPRNHTTQGRERKKSVRVYVYVIATPFSRIQFITFAPDRPGARINIRKGNASKVKTPPIRKITLKYSGISDPPNLRNVRNHVTHGSALRISA